MDGVKERLEYIKPSQGQDRRGGGKRVEGGKRRHGPSKGMKIGVRRDFRSRVLTSFPLAWNLEASPSQIPKPPSKLCVGFPSLPALWP